MPIVPFEALPDSARVWVFASDQPLTGAAADSLLAAVDRFLAEWKAHGVPLRCARAWRDDHFLAIGVDVTAENASGCSIDGLFRALRELERATGSRLVGGGRLFYRGPNGIQAVSRDEFAERAARGEIAPGTHVFDITVTDAERWRTGFELAASETWTASLLGQPHR
ncbi:MAG TPA: hypothetical protein VHB25_06650 [Gemmatimonadaceae bacterium]|nr:hypothetical protein [Gemmatimonadaceae bacterium]